MSTTPRILGPVANGRSTSALGHQPELAAMFSALYGEFWSRGVVDHPSKEAARLRNARITDCGY
jgi:hypothetical protein